MRDHLDLPPNAVRRSEARLVTGLPRRCLTQVCRHFAATLPVVLEEWRGRIAFPGGVCELDGESEHVMLIVRISAADETALTAIEAAVGQHLERWVVRDGATISWTRVAEDAAPRRAPRRGREVSRV